jgi:hypothetical protein
MGVVPGLAGVRKGRAQNGGAKWLPYWNKVKCYMKDRERQNEIKPPPVS